MRVHDLLISPESWLGTIASDAGYSFQMSKKQWVGFGLLGAAIVKVENSCLELTNKIKVFDSKKANSAGVPLCEFADRRIQIRVNYARSLLPKFCGSRVNFITVVVEFLDVVPLRGLAFITPERL